MTVEISFDEATLTARIAKVSLAILNRMGAYVRKVAQSKVKTSPNPSPPGSPPHSRKGLLRRAILFGAEPDRKRVLIGPGFRFVGTSASAHEFGGGYKGDRYPKRPFMGPALRESIPHLAELWRDAVK